MKQFRMKYYLWSTNNSSKNENSEGKRPLLSEQKVGKSIRNEVNYTLTEPAESHYFASRDKIGLRFDSKDTSPGCDDEWLELCRVQNENSETELNKTSESYIEMSSEHFPNYAINESFSEESDISLNFQNSLTTEPDNAKATDGLLQMMKTRDGNLVHQSITPASDLKAVVRSIGDLEIKSETQREVLESSLQLPSLDTLPAKYINASSRSSVLSFSSLTGSTEGVEDENSAAGERKVSQSESFIKKMNCFGVKSSAKVNSLSFNKFENVSDQKTGGGSRQSQFSTSNLKSPLNENRSLSSHVQKQQQQQQMSPETTAMNQIALNEKLPLKCISTYLSTNDSSLENVESLAKRTEENLNVNNITNESLQQQRLEALPPLPPNRRQRTQSQSSQSVSFIEDRFNIRSTTPPPSYQRNELLLNKNGEIDDDSHHKSHLSCFPYPSLVRFPPPRHRKRTKSIEEEEGVHSIIHREVKDVKPKQDVKEANLIVHSSNQPPATRIGTKDVPQINDGVDKQKHSTDQETVTPQTTDRQVCVKPEEATPATQEQVINSHVADKDDMSTGSNSCDKQVLSCCTLL